MNEFPQHIKFQYNWRKYQQRVLDHLDEYLKDKHLHIIAPPGAGKTILGLEVAIRINQPTLILAPTIAIRNQWIQRFCELFLQTNIAPDWISTDVRNPGFMTVVTYQGLHAACNNQLILDKEIEDEEEVDNDDEVQLLNKNLDNIVNGLKYQKVKTIIVDEAHHLKNEWWQTLTKVKAGLDPILVGLTATPPYDVTPNEWQRYLELNGPVDVEISTPELVIEGDLCPHQDYVYFSLPTQEENQHINHFREGITELFEGLKDDEILISAIKGHPFWTEPVEHLEEIYNNLSFYSSCLIFLHTNGLDIPETHMDIIGEKNLLIPDFDYSWAATLLDFYLYKEKVNFKGFEEHQNILENRLRRYGALEKRQINLLQNKKVTGFLTASMSKLNAIREIVDFEYKQLGTDLRLVVLTDYIRKEFYVDTPENSLALNKIGVLTIFEKLRRENKAGIKIGVLTGAMVIIPKSAYALLQEKTQQYGIFNLSCSPVPFDKDYILIDQSEQMKNDIVNIVTQIFQMGYIEVLIGTKSLLGEGWDAPAINSLILASFVGSFVLSNQMRGRAIRTQKENSNKTGNIWHLACIDTTSANGGDDVDLLKRRFKSFVGISFKNDGGIENGIGRLNIPDHMRLVNEVSRQNEETFSYAGNRKSLSDRWNSALEKGIVLVEEIKIPFLEEKEYKVVKKMYSNKTIANLMITLGFGLFAFLDVVFQSFLRSLKNLQSIEGFYSFFAVFGGLAVILFGGRTIKFLNLYIKYRDISKDIQQIGMALLNTLIKVKIISTDSSKLNVTSSIDSYGAIYCHLEGGTTFERSAFINALKEVIAPINNPRYVMIRRGSLMFFINQKDYHSVPEIIGRNKSTAVYFKDEWSSLVGACDLIFTRTIEGRKLLLESRMKSLASQFSSSIEHVNKWR